MAENDDSREKRLAYQRAWCARNREKKNAYQRAQYAANPEKAKEKARKNMAQKRRNMPLLRYNTHKANARKRGVEFLLTFDEWWTIWSASGKWDQRGMHKGEYVMGRRGDSGAYAVGNVIIISKDENNAERNRGQRGKPPSQKQLAAIAKARIARHPNASRPDA